MTFESMNHSTAEVFSSLADKILSCQICDSLNLLYMFREGYKAILKRPLSLFTQHTCPFTKVLRMALDLRCGPLWMSSITDSGSVDSVNLLFRSKGWACMYMQGKKRDRTGKPISVHELRHPRIIVAIDKRPPTAELMLSRRRAIDSEDAPYIIAELELQETSESNLTAHQESTPPPRRPIGNRFDCALARQWLEACIRHKTYKSAPVAHLWQPPGFRLIDINRGCLVQETERRDYVVLSYVWGKSADPALRTVRSNVDALSMAGTLDLNGSMAFDGQKVALTIVDAMKVVQRLGHRYLWVDMLCIVQDDEQEKSRLIHGMDRVYENAVLTIVNVAGLDSDAGLRGITSRESLPYESGFTVIKDSCAYEIAISRPSLVDEVQRSEWNRRGWTYQEHGLSQRCLYFTTHEVFFTCKKCHLREGYDYERNPSNGNAKFRTGPPWWTDRVILDPIPSPHRCLISKAAELSFDKYRFVVEEYSRRNFSHSEDILNAFQGVFNRFCGPASIDDPFASYAQGIPPRFLPQALLWYPLEGSVRRKCRNEAKNAKFSSWTWASWRGPVEFIFSRNSGLDRNSGFTLGARHLRSVVVAWSLQCRSHTWDKAEVPKGAALQWLQRYYPDDFAAKDEFQPSTQREDRPEQDGAIEFWAPVIHSNVSFLPGEGNAWNVEVELLSEAYEKTLKGRFRFDEPEQQCRVDEIVAIMVSPGAVSFIGVMNEGHISVRVGIGSIFRSGAYGVDSTLKWCFTGNEYEGDLEFYGKPKRDHPLWNPMGWKIRLVRMY